MGKQELLTKLLHTVFILINMQRRLVLFNALDKQCHFNISNSYVITSDASNTELKHQHFHQEYHKLYAFYEHIYSFFIYS